MTSDGELRAPVLDSMDTVFAQGFKYLLDETKIPFEKDDERNTQR